MSVLCLGQSRASHFSTTSSTEDTSLRNGGGSLIGGCEFQQIGGKNSRLLYVWTALSSQTNKFILQCRCLTTQVDNVDLHLADNIFGGESTQSFFCWAAWMTSLSAWIMQSFENNFKSLVWVTTCRRIVKHLIAQLVCWLLEEDLTDWISPLFPTLTGQS